MLARYARLTAKSAFCPYYSQSRSFAQTTYNTANNASHAEQTAAPGSQTFQYNVENLSSLSPLGLYRVREYFFSYNVYVLDIRPSYFEF